MKAKTDSLSYLKLSAAIFPPHGNEALENEADIK